MIKKYTANSFHASDKLKEAGVYLLAALLRYPAELPDNLRSINQDRVNACAIGAQYKVICDHRVILEALKQYEKNGVYTIVTLQYETKRNDLGKIAAKTLDADLGFYIDVWNSEYCNWALSCALSACTNELQITNNYEEAQKAFNDVKEALFYDLQAQNESNWREEHAQEVERKLAGIKSECNTKNMVPGYRDVLPEFEKGTVNIIAARPGMGKTQLELALLQGFEQQQAYAVVYTLEMPGRNLARRILCAMAGVNHRADWKELSETKRQKIKECSDLIVNAKYDFRDANNLRQIIAEARQLKKQGKLDVLMIDHIGLARTGDPYRDRDDNKRVSEITGAMVSLSKELDIPVILLSQLSRAIETRGGTKRPMLSDLRDSGAVEQDADTVTFIYRPEYYGISEDEQGRSNVGIAELIVAKYRDGAIGTGVCGFHPVMGFAFSEEEMRSTEQAKIINAIATRDHQMPDTEPEWVQSKETAKPNRNDEDISF